MRLSFCKIVLVFIVAATMWMIVMISAAGATTLHPAHENTTVECEGNVLWHCGSARGTRCP